MSISENPLVDSTLALPQEERADLALQLLQSLELPGEEVTAQELGQELRDRAEKYRQSEIDSSSLDEVRAIIEKRIAEKS